jgi:hypothetical protein
MEKILKYVTFIMAFLIIAGIVIATQTQVSDTGVVASNFSCTNCLAEKQIKDVYLVNNAADSTAYALTAANFSCVDCIAEKQIKDVYLLKTGGAISGDITGIDQANFSARGDYHSGISITSGYPSIELKALNNQSRPGILWYDQNNSETVVLEVHDRQGNESHKHFKIYATEEDGHLATRLTIPYGVNGTDAQIQFTGYTIAQGDTYIYPFLAQSSPSNFFQVGYQSYNKGTGYFYRDYNSSITQAPLIYGFIDNALDNQPSMTLHNDGTGEVLRLNGDSKTAINITGTAKRITFGNGIFVTFNSTRKGGSLCLQHTNVYLCLNSTAIYSS